MQRLAAGHRDEEFWPADVTRARLVEMVGHQDARSNGDFTDVSHVRRRMMDA